MSPRAALQKELNTPLHPFELRQTTLSYKLRLGSNEIPRWAGARDAVTG